MHEDQAEGHACMTRGISLQHKRGSSQGYIEATPRGWKLLEGKGQVGQAEVEVRQHRCGLRDALRLIEDL